jgi:hypothetical protein
VGISVLRSSNRRTISASSATIPAEALATVAGTVGACEMDSHADTTCFGANFTPIAWTGQTCSVAPFSDHYSAMEDVPIAHAATAWDNPQTGETVLLLFYYGLWFGTKLSHSLISPNQCRSIGVSICDDPWDPHRSLHLSDPHEQVTIPLSFSRNIVSFVTRAPSEEELDTCRRIVLTSQSGWDPAKLGTSPSSREEEAMTRIVSEVRLDPDVQVGDGIVMLMDDCNADRLLVSCSEALSEKALVHRLISSIRIASEFEDEEEPVELDLAALKPDFTISSATSTTRHSKVTPSEISLRFGCGLETAAKTIRATTQYGVRTATGSLTRRYKTNIMHLGRRRLKCTFFNDTMFAKKRSLRGNGSAEVFTNGAYVHITPTPNKTGQTVGQALLELIHEVGVPAKIVVDGASEKLGPKTKWMEIIRENHIDQGVTEAYSHWQNRAEDAIREVRRRWRLLYQRRNIPKRLWDYAVVHIARIMSLTVRAGSDRTPMELITGETPDISEYIDFDFYDWVWYIDNPNDKEDPPKLGRWLGVAESYGAGMCFFVLAKNAKVLARSTVQHVTRSEEANSEIKARMTTYDAEVNARLDDTNHTNEPTREGDILLDDDDNSIVTPMEESPFAEADDEWESSDAFDELVGAKVMLPRGDGRIEAQVLKRKRDDDGKALGRKHQNPMMDSRQYEVQLADGTVEDVFANTIAENLYSQVDSEGRQYYLLREIVDHRRDDTALSKDEAWIKHGSNRTRRKTTKGWHLLVEWAEGSSDWIPLKDLKETHPVEVAEYARANKISDEPAFVWWVGDVLRKRNHIISKVASRYWKTTHKFGIEIPKSVKHALEIDKRNGNRFWEMATKKEMDKIRSMGTFERWDKGSAADLKSGRVKLPGYQRITCHMVFDVKMDGNFTRKARFVANGAKTDDVPAFLTYSSVVTRESVRIAFLYAALNDLTVFSCDVTNAYLNAPCREKIWVEAGPEFGDADVGSVMIIRKAAYGLKSSGFSWRQTLSQTIRDMGYVCTQADPDVYRRRAIKANGEAYYELLLTYVDDILCVSQKPNETLDAIKRVYALKEDGKEPDRYLGANVQKVQLPSGRESWSMSSDDYIASALQIVKGMLEKDQRSLNMKHADRPMPESYHPELDATPELEPELANRYQQLIGMLRWACELGRVDILLEVSLMSSHLCMPREGHLEKVYGIFSYLEKHKKSNMIFDPTPVDLDETAFHKTDWKDSIYGNVSEEVPPNAPEPLGKPVNITCFVDADHAGEKVTRRSQTGFIIYLNNAPIDWFSKKQNTVESSTFGSEFVAMRIATERLRALRYKLRMFGIPIDGPASMLCDNESVVGSASKMESKLNKKHNAICFHTVREACAAGWLRVGKEPTESNIADLFTKMLSLELRRRHLRAIFIKKVQPATVTVSTISQKASKTKKRKLSFAVGTKTRDGWLGPKNLGKGMVTVWRRFPDEGTS